MTVLSFIVIKHVGKISSLIIWILSRLKVVFKISIL